MAFSYHLFEELLEASDDAIAYFESLGIPTAGTRLDMVRHALRDLLRDLHGLPSEEFVRKRGTNETYYLLADAAGFARIAREMAKVPSNLLPRRKLRTILEGPLALRDEDPARGGVNGRNIFAELELAADFSEKGLEPRGFDDLAISFAGKGIHFQCKRLHSARQVPLNMATAIRQLSSSMPVDGDRGLVGLVLDRVMGVDSRVLRVADDDAVVAAVDELVQRFCAEYVHSLMPPLDTRIIGIAFVVRFLVHAEHRGIVGTAYNVAINPYVRRERPFESRDRDLLERMVLLLDSRARSRPWPVGA